MERPLRRLLVPSLLSLLVVVPSVPAADDPEAGATGRVFYVRQTVGNDWNDGLSPQTAWASITPLAQAMQAGDTVYVGPGLYREKVPVANSGTAERRITFIADPTGEHTGDPPGIVLISGADPIDETIFEPMPQPGVYKAMTPDSHVLGVVEMDGDQYRFTKASDTKLHRLDKLTELEVVAKLPHSFHYDREERAVYIHTSDGKPPTTHEIEFIRRGNGIVTYAKHYVTVVGFHFRHMGDGGISFFTGSSNGIAVNNVSWGGRQGVRVYNATNILVAGNVLFRNDNSGVYFAKESTDGFAIDNILYENIKGVRWGSSSVRGLAISNIAFDNSERGIAIEDTDDIRVTGNTLVNNNLSQLLVRKSRHLSQQNCFDKGGTDQLIIDHFRPYRTLADYRVAESQDLSSREGSCGALPEKVDVQKLHAESMAYTARARKILAEAEASLPDSASNRR